MSTLEKLQTILAEYQGVGLALDPHRETLAPRDWQGIADKCKAASLRCNPDDDGIWFDDGKLTIAKEAKIWTWVWIPNEVVLEQVNVTLNFRKHGETDGR